MNDLWGNPGYEPSQFIKDEVERLFVEKGWKAQIQDLAAIIDRLKREEAEATCWKN